MRNLKKMSLAIVCSMGLIGSAIAADPMHTKPMPMNTTPMTNTPTTPTGEGTPPEMSRHWDKPVHPKN